MSTQFFPRGHARTGCPYQTSIRLCTKSHEGPLLCATSVFSVSRWLTNSKQKHTTETQRTQRLHREIMPSSRLHCLLWPFGGGLCVKAGCFSKDRAELDIQLERVAFASVSTWTNLTPSPLQARDRCVITRLKFWPTIIWRSPWACNAPQDERPHTRRMNAMSGRIFFWDYSSVARSNAPCLHEESKWSSSHPTRSRWTFQLIVRRT